MEIITKVFPGTSVLQVNIAPEKLGISFLNWRVRSCIGRGGEDFSGAGLYGVCYQDKLIYIGKFLGTRLDPFAGNVVRARWWAHFASLTLRGHRLSIPRQTLRQLTTDVTLSLNKTIQIELLRAPLEISNDHGCVTSLNRSRFALQNWNRFSGADSHDVLKDFSFIYSRVANASVDVDKIRGAISKAEKSAIEQLSPIANSDIKCDKKLHDVSCEAAKNSIEKILRGECDRCEYSGNY